MFFRLSSFRLLSNQQWQNTNIKFDQECLFFSKSCRHTGIYFGKGLYSIVQIVMTLLKIVYMYIITFKYFVLITMYNIGLICLQSNLFEPVSLTKFILSFTFWELISEDDYHISLFQSIVLQYLFLMLSFLFRCIEIASKQ